MPFLFAFHQSLCDRYAVATGNVPAAPQPPQGKSQYADSVSTQAGKKTRTVSFATLAENWEKPGFLGGIMKGK